MTILFQNQTADDDSLEHEHKGGELQIAVVGTMGGCSIQPQINQENLGYISFGDPITTEVAFFIKLKQSSVKFVMTGATGTTDVSLSAL